MDNEVRDYSFPDDKTTYYEIKSDDIQFEIGNDPGWEISIAITTNDSKMYHTTVTVAQLQDLQKLLQYVLDNVLEGE